MDLVGGTPLVKLSRVTRGLWPGAEEGKGPLVLAKVEYLNPGGSIKDRIALKMVLEAEASGALQPGGTIVEPTSGNTGVGLALVAQQRGYRCIFVCPDKVSEDKRNVLRAYGAEVVVCPTAVEPSHPDSYYSTSDRLARESPGGWKPDQYSNPAGPASHYETTGPEIWDDTDGRVTHVVTGVDSGGTGRPYLVEGVGEDFWPSAYDPAVPDEIVAVSDAESFHMTRRLAREEGLLVGGSCGMAAVGALRVAKRLAEEGRDDAVVVVILPDGGRGYLSKIFDDRWMASYGFVAPNGGRTASDVLRSKTGDLPALVHTHPNETLRDAIGILRTYGVSQMPVVKAEPPITSGEVAGAVTEEHLLQRVFTGAATLADPVEKHMDSPLPLMGAGESVDAVREALTLSDAVLVVEDGKPVGVLTRLDLLGFLAQ